MSLNPKSVIYAVSDVFTFCDTLQERERMLAHFQELKAQMNKVRDVEREKLTKVTLESNAAIKEIKRQKEKVR